MPVLFVLACLLCGLYGALHNQLSYTISPEYFTKFKFAQFQVSPHLPDRVGAAWVGWQASWWMGVVIGFFLIPAGLLIRDTNGFIVAVLRAFLVVLITTVCCGLAACFIAYAVIHADPTDRYVYRDTVISDAAAFRRAGALHNFSYLGGLIGIFTGLTSIFRAFFAENARLQSPEPKVDDRQPSENV